MALWAISDVHGCYTQFQELLNAISLGDEDELYVMGDMCDRGPESAEMLLWCVDIAPKNVHFLLGNHEDMAGCVIGRDPKGMRMSPLNPWAHNGGRGSRRGLLKLTDAEWRAERLVPWLRELSPFCLVEVDGREIMLVHAGFDPRQWDNSVKRLHCVGLSGPFAHMATVEVGHGFGTQLEQHMIWVRRGWFDAPVPAPLETVFGHTPTTSLACGSYRLPEGMLASDEEIVFGRAWHHLNRHDIDCGCAYGGRLCALRLDDFEEVYVKGL